MNKSAIKNFAIWARRKLIADITYKAGLFGVTENGAPDELPASTADLKLYDIGTSQPARVSGDAIEQRRQLIAAIHGKMIGGDFKAAFNKVVEEIAYTWFNRLIALRFMEVNDYLPSRVRVLSSENPSKAEPDFVTTPFDTDLEFTDVQRREVLRLKDENRLNDLFRMLFIMQCNKLHEILPYLFESTNDYTELLLTISFTDTDGVVWHLIHDISEKDFNVEKEGQVEIIGWLYQYYNSEPKDTVFGRQTGTKIKKENIPAATQLFTPDWIVRYMVENSLGRIWVEGHPEFDKHKWKYYLEEAEQELDVQIQLEALCEERKNLRPEDIRCIDPCAGSGHILVYLFDVLMQIYISQGYDKRDAAKLILEKNLYGLDIDDRAAQLAYFAVMMKARGVDRKFFSYGVQPHVYAVPEIKTELQKPSHEFDMGIQLYNAFRDGKEVGSLLDVGLSESDLNLLKIHMDQMECSGDFIDLAAVQAVRPLWDIAMILQQKYHVTVTNPPYMNPGIVDGKLADFVKDNYPNSKTDMFAVFIERCKEMTKSNGYFALVTQQSWLFLASYEGLRKSLVAEENICSVLEIGFNSFPELNSKLACAASFIVRRMKLRGYIGSHIDVNNKYGKSSDKEEAFFREINTAYKKDLDVLSVIPGYPLAFWVSESFIHNYKIGTPLKKFSSIFEGLKTRDKDRFVRYWPEVSTPQWLPYAKGGSYRKWYGNNDFVVKWGKDGAEIRAFKKSSGSNYAYYFQPTITYTALTYQFSARFIDNQLFGGGGGGITNSKHTKYILGFVNTAVYNYLMNSFSQTLNYEVGQIGNQPLIIDNQRYDGIVELVNNNINISKADWDSFETSWDFQRHPLVRLKDFSPEIDTFGLAQVAHYYEEGPEVSSPIEACYLRWKKECDERFNQLKANEEELNRIFIDIYGLQDELIPDVPDKDVTVRHANLQRDIKSLISYAVGCMFGRYSPDVPGLVFAGGSFDDVYGTAREAWTTHDGNIITTHDGEPIEFGIQYGTVKRDGREISLSYRPDADNCIIITDEPYFEDDIVGRFVEFIRVLYGADTLEANLAFIAKALGGKGNTSREIIRNYFINDFYKDHCTTYSVTGSGKRPIYWLFDSGKQNGFKALVYMHRWNADTVGNVRVEYLHRIQRVYEKEMERMQTVMESGSAREASAAAKRLDRLTKQLKETRDYDTRIAHAALSRVTIDLDDGVKVNYEKVQQGPDGKSLNLLAKIK